MRASARFCTGGQPLCSGHTLLPRASAPRRLPVLASRKKAAGGGGDAARDRPRREEVHFVVHGQPPLAVAYVTEENLESLLVSLHALGFETADGCCSRQLEDLPEGGTVNVLLSAEPAFGKQAAFENSTRIKELDLEAFLATLASTEGAGASVTALQTAPFKTADGQEYVQLHAAIRAGRRLYVGEMERVLDEDGMANLRAKLALIRWALRAGASPDLAAALQGVTEVNLFLAGEVVRDGLPVPLMVDIAAAEGLTVVLPSGQGLGIVGGATPAPTVHL